MVKILIDILHPTHVYFFREFISEMTRKGHKILVVSREKECVQELLDHYQITHTKIDKRKNLLSELIHRTRTIYSISKREKVDVLMGCMGPSITLVGKLLRKPSIVFYDNEEAKLTNWYVQRLATRFITSHTWEGKRLKNHVDYQSIQQRAYLPGEIKREKPTLSLLRLSAHKSSHDTFVKGVKEPIKIVKMLKDCKISSEKLLEGELKSYELMIKPWELHEQIAKAHIVVGDSPTLCCEAAMFGVPSIYVGNTRRGYIEYLKKKGIVFECKEDEVEKTIMHATKINAEKIHKEIMEENKEVTRWIIERIENNSFWQQ